VRTFGLTGGIGTGKSTVAQLLCERGVPVIDADAVAREVVAPGSPALAEIARVFGPEVLTPSGELDRPAMRRLITQDPEAKRGLELITHPRIGEGVTGRLESLAADGFNLAGVEAALMVETGSWRRYDRLVVVTCAPEQQLARVMARDGVDEAAARAIIAAQLPLADKVAVAHHVVHNDGAPEALVKQVGRLVVALKG
jgi:dephospho-CoA kinase